MTTDRITWQRGEEVLIRELDAAFEATDTAALPLQANDRRTLRLLALPATREAQTEAVASLDVVTKQYHRRPGIRGLRDLAKRAIRRSAARREWEGLTRLAALDLPAPRPIALGHTEAGEAILVTEFVPGRPLAEALADGAVEQPAEVANAIAASIHRLHAHGHLHGDLHLGNLRYSSGQVVILDPQRMRHSRRRSQILLDWARLDASIERAGSRLRPNAATAATRLGEFQHLLRAASGLGSELDRARLALDRDDLRGRARRRFRRDRDWREIAWPPAFQGIAVDEIEKGALKASIAAPHPDAAEGARRGGRVRLREESLGEVRVVRKRVDSGSLRRAVADRLRGSAGARAFRRGQRAGLVSDRCARPLAFVDERRFGLPVRSWSWTQKVGDDDLDQALAANPGRAREIAESLARWLAEGHARGLHHRDLKATNLRVSLSETEIRFWFIDLEDLAPLARPTTRERIAALAQLNASIRDEDLDRSARLAALECYAGRLAFDRPIGTITTAIAEQSRARAHRWQGTDCPADRS